MPGITPSPPPAGTGGEVRTGGMDEAALVALGERLYAERCALCHDAAGDRAPGLGRIALVAAERVKDPSYRGGAADAAGYMMESMVSPSAYVAPGYGKVGSPGAASPMPGFSEGPARLEEAELAALVAYMQALSGAAVTVSVEGGPEGEGER